MTDGSLQRKLAENLASSEQVIDERIERFMITPAPNELKLLVDALEHYAWCWIRVKAND